MPSEFDTTLKRLSAIATIMTLVLILYINFGMNPTAKAEVMSVFKSIKFSIFSVFQTPPTETKTYETSSWSNWNINLNEIGLVKYENQIVSSAITLGSTSTGCGYVDDPKTTLYADNEKIKDWGTCFTTSDTVNIDKKYLNDGTVAFTFSARIPALYPQFGKFAVKYIPNEFDFQGTCPEGFSLFETKCMIICPTGTESINSFCTYIDSDNDGVADINDLCPTVFAKTVDGCPIPEPTVWIIKDDKCILIKESAAVDEDVFNTENECTDKLESLKKMGMFVGIGLIAGLVIVGVSILYLFVVRKR